eukprot:11191905-Lingulodinium_polyedra.AAC.1
MPLVHQRHGAATRKRLPSAQDAPGLPPPHRPPTGWGARVGQDRTRHDRRGGVGRKAPGADPQA